MTLLVWASLAYGGPYGWDGERTPSSVGPGPVAQVWLWQPEGEATLGCEDAPQGCLEVSRQWSTRSGGAWWRVRLEEDIDPWTYRDAYRATGAWVLVEPTRLPLALEWREGVVPASWADPSVEAGPLLPGVRAAVVGYAADPERIERSEAPIPTLFGEGLEDALIDLMLAHAGVEAGARASMSHHPVHTEERGFHTAHAVGEACGRVGPGGVVLLLTHTWSEGAYRSAVVNPMVEDAVLSCVEGGVLVVAPEGNNLSSPLEEVPVAELEHAGPLVIGAWGADPGLWGATRASTVLWADPTVQIGDQVWAGTAASAARVAGVAWGIQSEFVRGQGEPLTPADLQRFLRVSSYEPGTPERVPHLQGGIDRLGGPRVDRGFVVPGGLGLIAGLACVSMGVLVCTGFFIWLVRGLFSRRNV